MKFMIVAALSLAPLAPAQDCPNVSSSLIEDAPIYDISGSSLLTVLEIPFADDSLVGDWLSVKTTKEDPPELFRIVSNQYFAQGDTSVFTVAEDLENAGGSDWWLFDTMDVFSIVPSFEEADLVSAFCFGEASVCPCQAGGPGEGCALPQGTGVELTIEDFEPDCAGGGSAFFQGQGFPATTSPTVIAIRSPNVEPNPVVFGDGARCVGLPVVRFGAGAATGGFYTRSFSHGAGAGTFRYQLWFRSTPAAYCDPSAAFNLSNGLEITWPD